jgi:hypothetical protein
MASFGHFAFPISGHDAPIRQVVVVLFGNSHDSRHVYCSPFWIVSIHDATAPAFAFAAPRLDPPNMILKLAGLVA